MKPISYNQEMGDTERICTWEGPTGSCSISGGAERTTTKYAILAY